MKLQINYVTGNSLGEGKEIEKCEQEIISANTMIQDPSGVRELTNFPGWSLQLFHTDPSTSTVF